MKIEKYVFDKHAKQIESYLFDNPDDKEKTCITGFIDRKTASYWKPDFVAIKNDKVVGFIFGNMNVPHSEIKELLVFKGNRGEGIASKLIQKFEEYVLVNNSNIISLTCFKYNKDSLSFYKHKGFIETGYKKYNTYFNNKWYEGIILSKKLLTS